ncbi:MULTISPECIES: hypothetical protein [Nocardia]|uniref:hypothetical protein n=1 Tax=Nocardia TaxID=1817 RepID=UPI000FE22EA8|nr:hypothetical protein [Nocardia africana]MCC3317816.1 hypothetical protein [Nocardia africana]
MLQWRPGIPPAEVAAAVEIDPAPVLRLAATLPATDTAHAVLLELVQHVQYRASEYAEHTIQTVTEDPKVAAWVELAATSLPVPAPAELGEVVLRDGWLTVAARTDTLAHQSVVQALRYGHTAALPYTSAEYIDPTTGLGAEWAARLEPTSPYAGFEVLYGHLEPGDEDTITDYLTDPATDAPALRLASGKLLAAVPHRLPAVSPLAEVTLGTPIWVRLDDGTVHLAPRRDAPGINWGYQGSGTNTLALLIAQLLDDITAPAATQLRGGGAGLERLLQTNWADGTTLTRAELEAARNSLQAPPPLFGRKLRSHNRRTAKGLPFLPCRPDACPGAGGGRTTQLPHSGSGTLRGNTRPDRRARRWSGSSSPRASGTIR